MAGYLRSYLRECMEKEWYVPVIIGIIWFLWQYHYFYQNGIEVPLLSFFIAVSQKALHMSICFSGVREILYPL